MSAAYPNEVLTAREVAAEAGVKLSTVRKWRDRDVGFPPAWREGQFGEPHLYLRADVVAWLARTGRVRSNR